VLAKRRGQSPAVIASAKKAASAQQGKTLKRLASTPVRRGGGREAAPKAAPAKAVPKGTLQVHIDNKGASGGPRAILKSKKVEKNETSGGRGRGRAAPAPRGPAAKNAARSTGRQATARSATVNEARRGGAGGGARRTTVSGAIF
jgi:hypothetical protein